MRKPWLRKPSESFTLLECRPFTSSTFNTYLRGPLRRYMENGWENSAPPFEMEKTAVQFSTKTWRAKLIWNEWNPHTLGDPGSHVLCTGLHNTESWFYPFFCPIEGIWPRAFPLAGSPVISKRLQSEDRMLVSWKSVVFWVSWNRESPNSCPDQTSMWSSSSSLENEIFVPFFSFPVALTSSFQILAHVLHGVHIKEADSRSHPCRVWFRRR